MSTEPSSPARRLARRVVPLALLAIAAVAFVAAGGPHFLSFENLAANRDRLAALVAEWGLAAAGAYIGLYALLTALSVPCGIVMTLSGGLLFGTWLGALCAVVGATLGATGVFVAARAGFAGLTRRAGPRVARLEAGFRKDAFNYLLVLRLIPIVPFWLVNLVPALLGVRLRTFISATLLGIIPGAVVYASLGNGLGLAVGEPDLGILLRPSLLIPLVLLAVLVLVPVVYKRRRGKETA
jgi:uncharacterized membrane protein YdjX (TVP38/TMEM64 family)